MKRRLLLFGLVVLSLIGLASVVPDINEDVAMASSTDAQAAGFTCTVHWTIREKIQYQIDHNPALGLTDGLALINEKANDTFTRGLKSDRLAACDDAIEAVELMVGAPQNTLQADPDPQKEAAAFCRFQPEINELLNVERTCVIHDHTIELIQRGVYFDWSMPEAARRHKNCYGENPYLAGWTEIHRDDKGIYVRCPFSRDGQGQSLSAAQAACFGATDDDASEVAKQFATEALEQVGAIPSTIELALPDDVGQMRSSIEGLTSCQWVVNLPATATVVVGILTFNKTGRISMIIIPVYRADDGTITWTLAGMRSGVFGIQINR